LPKSDQLLKVQNELKRLGEENARLKALLAQHGIAWDGPIAPDLVAVPKELAPVPPQFTIEDKIVLFRRLFRGREDVFPRRWESAKGASGYAPVCGNEWKPGMCCKPKVKCGDCAHRLLLPLTNQVFYDHLAGQHTIGVYPLLQDDTCFFLAVDFERQRCTRLDFLCRTGSGPLSQAAWRRACQLHL